MVSVVVAGDGAGPSSLTVSPSVALAQPSRQHSDVGRKPEHVGDPMPKDSWLADGDLIVDFGKKKNLTFREALMDLSWVTWALNHQNQVKSPQAKTLLAYLQRRYKVTGASKTDHGTKDGVTCKTKKKQKETVEAETP